MKLSPLGDQAVVLSFGEEVDDAVVNRVRGVADGLAHARIDGIVDIVPAFASVAVYYDIARTGGFDRFEARVTEVAEKAANALVRTAAAIPFEIPVCYGGEYGVDLEDLAKGANLTINEAIELHAAAEYRVEAIGFVPGFAYLGGLPTRLHAPRRSTPRPQVPAGSVGIGGSQTGVYPLATPGGWNLIGRTPLRMFDAGRAQPSWLHTGDRVRFRPLTPEEFATWK